MDPQTQSKMTMFALLLSVVALALSGLTFAHNSQLTSELNGEAFSAKLEKGIEHYVKKQRAGQNGAKERVNVSVDDDAIKGDKNAPVTIVEFSDYECPFCGRFYTSTLPKLTNEYINTGKVKLVYRDFPLSFHQNARLAAMAAECARDQGGDKAYFEYHDHLYKNQKSFSAENFKKWAGDLGLKPAKFNTCLDNQTFAKEVEKDFKDGQSYGVSGAPAFFINGRKLSGAQPFSAFKAIIEEELK